MRITDLHALARQQYVAYGVGRAADDGVSRLAAGLGRYGATAYLEHSELSWLHEAYEELLDAFNMLGAMRLARGEGSIALGCLTGAIRLVRDEMHRLQVVTVPNPPLSTPARGQEVRFP